MPESISLPRDDTPRVGPNSYLTLHYRISLGNGGEDVISTFGSRPATFTLGLGQLAEPLEHAMLGLAEGAHAVFDLAAEQAYGAHNPEMVQTLSRASFDAHTDPDTDYAPGDPVDFARADGARIAGVLRALDAAQVVIDFNHPLAGQAIRFEVRILGVL